MKEISKEKLVERLKELSVYANSISEKLTRDFYRKYKTPTDYTESEILGLFATWSEALTYALERITPKMDEQVMLYSSDACPQDTTNVVGIDPNRHYKVLVIPDIHVPFQHNKSVNTMLKFAELYKPDHVIQLGDLVDFYKLSRYMKSPGRGSAVQQEVDKAHNLLNRIKEVSGAKKATMLTGNHEDRLHKYLCNQAPALTELKALKLENLLRLKEIGWELIPGSMFYRINGVHFTHGEYCTVFSALKHMTKYNETIIHGHTHVSKHTMARYLNKTIEAWEFGCLASMETSEEYVKMANWQHCFGTVELSGNDYWINSHHIRNGKVSFNGTLLEGSLEDPTR